MRRRAEGAEPRVSWLAPRAAANILLSVSFKVVCCESVAETCNGSTALYSGGISAPSSSHFAPAIVDAPAICGANVVV